MADYPTSLSPSPVKYTEDWAATRFTAKYGEAARFVHTTKRWLLFTPDGWLWDTTLVVQNLIRDLCREIATEARKDPELNGAQRAQTAQRFSSGRVIHGVEIILRSDPTHAFVFTKREFPDYPLAPTNGVEF